MNLSTHAPLHLLHQSLSGALATQLREPFGFPYPTWLPFAPDAQHCPIILISQLAEHTRNLQADPRAGFLIVSLNENEEKDLLSSERITLIGRFKPMEPSASLIQRYLRYHPSAKRYLALGDFTFWAMDIERLRYIGGFGAMQWLHRRELDPFPPISDDETLALTQFFDTHPQRPATLELAGIDRHGADLKVKERYKRFAFDTVKIELNELHDAIEKCITHKF